MPHTGPEMQLSPDGNFGQCIFERDKRGQLQRIKYSSEWKQTRKDPRRGPIDRRINPERRSLNAAVWEPIRNARKEQRRKNAPERRNLRRLTCEGCLKDFPDVPSLVEHLPCSASHELVLLGFWDFIARIKKNGGPSSGEIEKLRNVLFSSLSEDAYRIACAEDIFVPLRNVSEQENLRAYRVEWLAALLYLIRPNQINFGFVGRIDREEISRITETFNRVPEGPQKKIIRQLFVSSIKLEEIGKTGRVPAKPISGKTRTAILETEGIRGQRRARAMTTLGADYWSPLTPLQAYQMDATGFSRDLYTLGHRIHRKTRNSPKSSPASK